MPRCSEECSPIDAGETKEVSYGFGPQGGNKRPLALGEVITGVSFQMTLIAGTDPIPADRLIGAPVIEPGGMIVTQKVGAFVSRSGNEYDLQATAITSNGQVLTPFGRITIN